MRGLFGFYRGEGDQECRRDFRPKFLEFRLKFVHLNHGFREEEHQLRLLQELGLRLAGRLRLVSESYSPVVQGTSCRLYS